MNSRWLACAAFGAFLISMPRAQDEGRVVPFAVAPTLTAALIDEPHGDGVFWVLGDTYKARVAADGVTFYPLFAGAAGHTPFHLRYRHGAARSVARRGEEFELPHDGKLTERWIAGLQGMEQVFVLHAPPATAGLTLRLDVTTTLDYRGYDRGLVFAAGDGGEIRYGEGVVFDSAGRRQPIVPAFDGAAITLAVPPAFLAGAVYPVTVDPLLGNFAVAGSANNFHPDIVREPTTGDFVVVYERSLNAADRDIHLQRFSAAGALVNSVALDITTDLCIDPKVCATRSSSGVIAVWDDQTGGNKGIQAREYRLALTQAQVLVQLTNDGVLADSRQPDVGGGSLVANGSLGQMLVFVRTSLGNDSLRAIRLLATGAPSSAEFEIHGAPGCDPRPDIAPSAGEPLHWGVTWKKRNAVCGSADQWWAVLHGSGVLLPAELANVATDDEVGQRVFTHGSDSLLMQARETSSFSWDLDGRMFVRIGSTFTSPGAWNYTAAEPGCPRTLVQEGAAIGFDGDRYCYAYLENQAPKAACLFESLGNPAFSEGHVALSSTANPCGGPAITHVPLPNLPSRFAIVWQEDLGATFAVRGAFYEARQAGTQLVTLPTGCGLVTQTGIAVDRMPIVGNDFTVSLSNVAGLGLLIAGFPAQNPPALCVAHSPCQQGVATILTSVFAPSLSVALPPSPSYVGMRLGFQGGDLGATGGCGAAIYGIPFRTTDTLVLTFR